ncbi:MAG: hypothetical protein JXD22_09100 [Sedimentisphaerales bacterium]|nr:hypothetical protein [Sedimentisphaerales bacterium]
MPMAIDITAGNYRLQAQLNDSATAQTIAAALPIEAAAQRWGDEIYFAIDVDAPLQADAHDVVQAGQLGYWPTGKAFCLFFGPTPASRGDEIRAASAVNIVGLLTGDFSCLKQVTNGQTIIIKKSE